MRDARRPGIRTMTPRTDRVTGGTSLLAPVRDRRRVSASGLMRGLRVVSVVLAGQCVAEACSGVVGLTASPLAVLASARQGRHRDGDVPDG